MFAVCWWYVALSIRVELSLPITSWFCSLLSLSLPILMTFILIYLAQSFRCVPLLPRIGLFMLPPSPVWQVGAPIGWNGLLSPLYLVQERLCGVRVQHGFSYWLLQHVQLFSGKLVGTNKEHCFVHLYIQFFINLPYCLFLYSLFINLSLLLIRVQHFYHINSQTRILIYHIC